MAAPIAKLEDDETDLDVPEEPYEDEDDSTVIDVKSMARSQNGDSSSTSSSTLGFMTAVRIARWMARAYGYLAKKKRVYVSQDKVLLPMILIRYLRRQRFYFSPVAENPNWMTSSEQFGTITKS